MDIEKLQKQLKRPISQEFHGAQLGDDRRRDRLYKIAESLGDNPSGSFPDVANSDSELEATYRFFSNASIEYEDILDPHIKASVDRLLELDEKLALHDTTEFSFSGENRAKGLGRLRVANTTGFFSHISLGVGLNGAQSVPTGVLHAKAFRRLAPPQRKRSRNKNREKESLKWLEGVNAVEKQLGSGKAIHVMDREADSYEILSEMVKKSEPICCSHDS